MLNMQHRNGLMKKEVGVQAKEDFKHSLTEDFSAVRSLSCQQPM